MFCLKQCRVPILVRTLNEITRKGHLFLLKIMIKSLPYTDVSNLLKKVFTFTLSVITPGQPTVGASRVV